MNNYAMWSVWVEGIHGVKKLEDYPDEDDMVIVETLHTSPIEVACEFIENHYTDAGIDPPYPDGESEEWEVWLIHQGSGAWYRVLVTVETELQVNFSGHKLALEPHYVDAATQTGMYDPEG